MKILLLGSGAREHAMAYNLSKSALVENLFIAPGNPGLASIGILQPLNLDDQASVLEFCNANQIDMVICGPEAPLAQGLMDYLELHNPDLILIGPKQKGAQLESSKAFAKEFMIKYEIPTARYQSFDKNQIQEAINFGKSLGLPLVIKADGLAAGKGVVITQSHEESEAEIKSMLAGKFGTASSTLVIEEFLSGIEFSVLYSPMVINMYCYQPLKTTKGLEKETLAQIRVEWALSLRFHLQMRR